MKILVVTRLDWKHPESGGGEVYLREVLTRLENRGHEILVLASPHTEKPDMNVEFIDGIKNSNSFRNHFNIDRKVKEVEDRFNPDIVLRNFYTLPWFHRTRSKSISVFHNFHGRQAFQTQDSYWMAQAMRVCEKIGFHLSRFDDEVISIGKRVSEGLEKASVDYKEIPNGVDTVNLQTSEKYDEPTLLHFGRLEKSKGSHMIPDIFKQVQNEVPDVKLEIAGHGSMEAELENWASSQSNVTFHGFVSLEKKEELLSKSWINVMPTASEGRPLVVLEACACGTMTIGSDVGGMRGAVNNQTGYLVDRTVDSFSKGIINCLENGAWKNLSESSRKYAEENSWDNVVDRMESLMD